MARSFGLVEAAQRAREWAPQLDTKGQRLVLAWLALYTSKWSTANPTIAQLAEVTGFDERSVRRILTQLCDFEVIAPTSERSKGGKPTEWVIQDPDRGVRVQPGPGSQGMDNIPGPGGAHTRTLEATNPDPIGSSTESTEISEKQICASHTFKKSKVGRRVYRRCTECGEKDGSTVGNIEKELSSEEVHLDGEDGEDLESIKVDLDRIYQKERAMGRYA